MYFPSSNEVISPKLTTKLSLRNSRTISLCSLTSIGVKLSIKTTPFPYLRPLHAIFLPDMGQGDRYRPLKKRILVKIEVEPGTAK